MVSQATKRSHYETLGVAEDATADEIKRAYRAKAKTTHPDTGAEQSEFEPVVRAYEVLRNPERRQLYDATGQDSRLPIELEVQQVLLQLFTQALASEEDIEIVAAVRSSISKQMGELPKQIQQLTKRNERLTAKRDKVTSKKAINVVHMLIDQEIKNNGATIAALDHQIQVGKECLKELKAYTEKAVKPVGRPFRGAISYGFYNFGSPTSTTT
jgi:curved DNA-binding protein CbpA